MNTRRHITGLSAQVAVAIACVFTLSFVPACGGGSAGGGGGGAAGGSGGGTAAADTGEATGAAFSQPSSVSIAEKDGLGIDTTHIAEGYVSVAAENSARLKFQVSCGDMTYNYDLPNDGTPMIYPINMGNGSYLFRIMQNTSGNNYVEYDAMSADVSLLNEFSPFLLPNMFCDYEPSSDCVAKALEVTSASTNQGEAVRDVCSYVAEHVTYDNDKAAELSKSTGYVPDPDETLGSGKGICFDYAALSAAMLRSLGIPAKVMTGYVGAEQVYHAWIMVYVDGKWETAMFSVKPKEWSRCDVTFASTGATKYVGDASAYTDRYTY